MELNKDIAEKFREKELSIKQLYENGITGFVDSTRGINAFVYEDKYVVLFKKIGQNGQSKFIYLGTTVHYEKNNDVMDMTRDLPTTEYLNMYN